MGNTNGNGNENNENEKKENRNKLNGGILGNNEKRKSKNDLKRIKNEEFINNNEYNNKNNKKNNKNNTNLLSNGIIKPASIGGTTRRRSSLRLKNKTLLKGKNDNLKGSESLRVPQSVIANKRDKYSIDFCINYVKDVKNPTRMLKYCSSGKLSRWKKPHYRKFVVSKDETRIQWWSNRRKESYIEFKDVREFVVGQTTLPFKQNPMKLMEGLSFSFLYGKGKMDDSNMWTGKSLDLICENKKQFIIWTKAIRFLKQDKRGTVYTRFVSNNNNLSSNGKKMNENEIRSNMNRELQINSYDEAKKNQEEFSKMGDLYAWGQGDHGALGTNDNETSYLPQIVRGSLLPDVTKISAGADSGIIVCKGGEVLSFGENSSGKLGHGTFKDFKEPQLIDAFKDIIIVQTSIGNQHTLLLDQDHNLYGCGSNENYQLAMKDKTNFSSPIVLNDFFHLNEKNNEVINFIDSGSAHNAIITNFGRLFTWGNGNDGQLGHGKEELRYIPKSVNFPFSLNQKEFENLNSNDDTIEKIISCALGCWHTLALTNKERVFAFGDNGFGQLGIEKDGKKELKIAITPKEVKFEKDVKPKQIKAGDYHSGIIDQQGRVWMWGNGMFGQIGNGTKKKATPIPVLIDTLIEPKKMNLLNYRCTCLSLGSNHAVSIYKKKKEILGLHNKLQATHSKTPSMMSIKLKKKVQDDLLVVSWGACGSGRLGNGQGNKDKASPVRISFLNNKKIRSVAAGKFNSFAIGAHMWVPDKDVKKCMICKTSFTFSNRRHHCRNCGAIVDSACSMKRIELLRFGFDGKVRVCDHCFTVLRNESSLNV